MIGSATEPESAAKPGTNGVHPGTNGEAQAQLDELARLLERNADRLGGLIGDLRILGNVESDRARLRLRRMFARAQGIFALSIGAVVLFAAGTVFVAVGLRGAFRALFADQAWLGDLTAGLVLIGALAAAWLGARSAAESSEAKRLEKKYVDMERKHTPRS